MSEAYELEVSERKLAADVLKIGEDGNSPYVNYPKANGENVICQVLYNADSPYGHQIMSSGELEDVTIGYGEGNAEEFQYSGTASIDDNFKQAVLSYNKAIETLNDMSEEYINPKYTENNEARSIGSIPNFSEKDTESGMCTDFEGTDYVSTLGFSGLLKDTDNNYDKDFEQLKTIKNGRLSKPYWLASRYISNTTSMNTLYFRIRIDNGTSTPSNAAVFRIAYNESKGYGAKVTNKLRPVLGLKSGLYIKSGLGTKTCPYNFE